MNNRMTVGANRSQVLDRIDDVFTTSPGYFSQVVNVDEPLCHVPIDFSEGYPTPITIGSVMIEALAPGFRIAFVHGENDGFRISFGSQIGRFWRITLEQFLKARLNVCVNCSVASWIGQPFPKTEDSHGGSLAERGAPEARSHQRARYTDAIPPSVVQPR